MIPKNYWIFILISFKAMENISGTSFIEGQLWKKSQCNIIEKHKVCSKNSIFIMHITIDIVALFLRLENNRQREILSQLS